MNMKVMNRVAIGTLFASSLALGMTSCGRSGHRNVDNILDEDTVEITNEEPQSEIEEYSGFKEEKPVSKAEEISYEHNLQIDKSNSNISEEGKKELDEMFKLRGTYGGSLYYEAANSYCGSINLANISINGITSPMERKMSEEFETWHVTRENTSVYDEYKYYHDYSIDCMNEGIAYKEELLDDVNEKLFSDGTPTASQCMTYLNRKLAGMDYVSSEDYDKVQKDIERYKKAQGPETTQTKAELMRYMMFKITALHDKNMLESRDLLKDIKVRKSYEKYYKMFDNAYWERLRAQ